MTQMLPKVTIDIDGHKNSSPDKKNLKITLGKFRLWLWVTQNMPISQLFPYMNHSYQEIYWSYVEPI